jgi:hypothetical protein
MSSSPFCVSRDCRIRFVGSEEYVISGASSRVYFIPLFLYVQHFRLSIFA